ncbi:MscL family protein [Mycetocola zhujimingii]|uniref:MscL family protein n=1 Tax=Mycetocola zhujimingii TaxID=2079792 RepID=UPI0013C407F5|nr:MscL family protein [Mycetocola zhujimingii]
MTRRHGPLVPLVIGLAALVGFGWIWIATESSDAPASTVRWFISESSLALAILVPAVCLFFVIRAIHTRRHEAREAARPPATGAQQAGDLLWSLSKGLLPQTTKAADIQTDATEPVFIARPAVITNHRQLTPATRTLMTTARTLVLSRDSDGVPGERAALRAWETPREVSFAATDRRFLLRDSTGLADVQYASIIAVHLVQGAVLLRLADRPPMLVICEHAESIAVLAVWGSAGEAALNRHPDFVSLRKS